MDARPGYTRRIIDDDLDEFMLGLAAIAIEGPRGVGKTSTAIQRSGTVLHMDDPITRELVETSPEQLRAVPAPVVIDEWQEHPPVWDRVRRAVDDGAEPGRFLLTGSAAPIIAPVHSGAGRIVTMRMRPMSLVERGVARPAVSLADLLTGARPDGNMASTDVTVSQYVDEILGSGFPGIRSLPPRLRLAQLDAYLQLVLDRDIPAQGHELRSPDTMRRWMRAYAAATATTATWETIRDAATAGSGDKPSRSATLPYRDSLMRIWLLDPIEAWLPTSSRIARLAAPPKHHLADPALAARLLDLDAAVLLGAAGGKLPAQSPGRSLLGALFEALVALDLRVYSKRSDATVMHMRTRGGREEVDFIVSAGAGRIVAIEAKLSGSVTDRDVRHLNWLEQQIGDQLIDKVVITTGQYAYRRRDGVLVLPLALLGP